jgi:glyceraldehyde-3-phosphate dehydrogenase (NADP+)
VAGSRERPHRGRDSPFDGRSPGRSRSPGRTTSAPRWTGAESGAVTWRRTPAHERMRILLRAAELADERAEQIAQIISAEAGR